MEAKIFVELKPPNACRPFPASAADTACIAKEVKLKVMDGVVPGDDVGGGCVVHIENACRVSGCLDTVETIESLSKSNGEG